MKKWTLPLKELQYINKNFKITKENLPSNLFYGNSPYSDNVILSIKINQGVVQKILESY